MPTTEHPQVLDRFVQFRKNKKLAHAYLFSGPKGVGKVQTALEVAKLVNCEDPEAADPGKGRPFCGTCPSCRKIDSGNHPDVTVIGTEEDEQSIKIAKIRELINRIQLKPYEGRMKVYIIRNIEDLTLEGSKALLKTLEEPAANSLLILTTSVLQSVLLTIRSRCQVIPFSPVAVFQLAGVLEKEGNCSSTEAHFLAYFSEGCLDRARQMQADEVFSRKNSVIDHFLNGSGNEKFIKDLLADKRLIRESLEVLLSWVRDALLLKSGAESSRLINRDRTAELTALARSVPLDRWQMLLRDITGAMRLLEENLNLKIPLILLQERFQWLSTTR